MYECLTFYFIKKQKKIVKDQKIARIILLKKTNLKPSSDILKQVFESKPSRSKI